jgi:NAD(P)H-hydrate repair Nnr-like enzyme with NAD(P)H-hydrate epimerase domain
VKKIFDEVRSLDKRAIEEFHLTEDILMENASFMEKMIRRGIVL